MKLRSILLAALGLLAAVACARADSTIDPTIPAQNAPLSSGPVRTNFDAARTDINNLLSQFAGPIAPANPTVGQFWRNTSVTPNLVFQWTGSQWVQTATFDAIANAVTPFFGNKLLAWQQLIPGLGTAGQCVVFTGTSTNPIAQNCINSANVVAIAPLLATFAGPNAMLSLQADSNFAVVSNNLALNSIGAGNLLCNPGASPAEPGPCGWNQFASRAIGNTNNTFPFFSSGAWGTLSLGTSTANPGTGTLESVLPVQTNTSGNGACTSACTYTSADFFRKTRRSNGGAAMSDTLPGAGTPGLTNGTRIVFMNADATASLTINAGSGTIMASGGTADVIGPGRDVAYEYDLSATQWRGAYNTRTALLGPNNLSDLSSAATAINNLFGTRNANLVFASASSGGAANPTFRALVGADLPNPSATTLGGIESFAAVPHQWINTISVLGVPSATVPNFNDLAGSLAPSQCPNGTTSAIGCLQVDGTTLNVVTGLISLNTAHSNTWTGIQSHADSTLNLNGLISGATTLRAAPTAGSGSFVFPSGTTNLSTSGGANQVVMQTSLGGPLTTSQLNCGNLSNATGACSAAAGQYPATATNDNAAAGDIGEYPNCSVSLGSAVSLTLGTAATVCSFGLAAGDWMVTATICYDGTVTATGMKSTISQNGSENSTPGSFAAQSFNSFNPTAVFDFCHTVGPFRRSLAGPETESFTARCSGSAGTCSAYGFGSARRPR